MLGTRIGNYQVTSQIGEGGMGAVYRAHHASLGRDAAVKVLLPRLSHDRTTVTRFFNEARAATAIHHPGIVEIYDVGQLADGSAYIVMELLEGESLAARMRRDGAQPPGRWLPLVRQIAGALHAAHEQGIVHRDLKPDNVFVIRDPEVAGGERIKLLDFGIAKLAHAPGDASQTRTGAVMGTPRYMAPEQCRDAGQVDARADLYALGCILYELACGRPPFVCDSVGELIAHHLFFPPASPRVHAPSLPVPVEALIVQLLHKDPGARPPGALAVIDAIDGIGERGDGSGVVRRALAPGPSAPALTTLSGAAGPTLPSAPSRARPRWWLAGTVAAAGIAGGLWLARGDDEPPAQAAAPAAAPAIDAAVTVPVDAGPPIDAGVPVDAAPPVDAAAPPRRATTRPRPTGSPPAAQPRPRKDPLGNQGLQPFED